MVFSIQHKFLCYWQWNTYRFKRVSESGQHLLHELYCASIDSYPLASGLLPVWPTHLPVSGWAWEMFSLWNLPSLSRGKFWLKPLYLLEIDTEILFTVLFREQSSINSAPIVTFNMDSRSALSRLRTTGCSRVFHRHAGRSSSPLQVLWSFAFFFRLLFFAFILYIFEVLSFFNNDLWCLQPFRGPTEQSQLQSNSQDNNSVNRCNCIIDQIFTGGLQSDVVCQACQ